jgi:hypothetical protein
MSPVYVETKTLPETILTALAGAGFKRPTIGVYVREQACMSSPSGEGMRGFTMLLDIDTGRHETHFGSWGGSNPFTASPVDGDTSMRPLPPNGCVISGHEGGGKPVYATLTIHPSRAAKFLPAPKDELSKRLSCLMAVFARFNSRGRAEWFERHGKATESELAELEAMGFIKRNKAGAVTCTAAGKNIAPPDAYLYRNDLA